MSRFNKNCWSDAEGVVFEHLVKETGSERDVNAFLGLMPIAGYNMWAMTTGGGDGSFLHGQGVPSDILTSAVIEVVYEDRAECQAMVMELMHSMPLRDSGNVALLRPNSIPEIEPDWIPVAGDPDSLQRVWVCFISCQLVYLTMEG